MESVVKKADTGVPVRDASKEVIVHLKKQAMLSPEFLELWSKIKQKTNDYIIYDSSTIEKPFAKALDDDPDVKMFFKIPDRFKIETPIGTYNPDWAVYLERDGEKKMFFILETKGTTELYGLRTPEQLKIHCGTEHFKALENGVEMRVAKDWKEFRVQN